MSDSTPQRLVREVKLVIIGSSGSGKSQLAIWLIQSHFVDGYDPTIEDTYRKKCVVDGEEVILDVLDTAGQEEYSLMREHYMKTGEGFFLVYSITSRDSFDNIRFYYERLLDVRKSKKVPIVIVGNNCDQEYRRVVSTAEGASLAMNLGCKFYEVSAKTRTNVNDAFSQLSREVRQHQVEEGQDLLITQDEAGSNEQRAAHRDHRCSLM